MGNILYGFAVLAAMLAVACGGSSDDDGDFRPIVRLTGDAAVQAAAEAAISLSVAVDLLLGESVAGASATVGEPSVAARAIRTDCPLGGTVEGECREEGGRTVVTTRSDDCSVFDSETGLTVTASGRLDVVYRARGICGAGIPSGVAAVSELETYSEQRRDGSAVVRTTEIDRLTIESVPATGGCSANQGRWTFDGDMRVRQAAEEVAMDLEDFVLSVDSRGNPCDERVALAGKMMLSDSRRGARFAASTAGLVLHRRHALDGVVEVAIEGATEIDCLGAVVYRTGERLSPGAECPGRGDLEIQFGGESSAVSFRATGARFDYGADGSIDFSAQGCGVDSLRVCR